MFKSSICSVAIIAMMGLPAVWAGDASVGAQIVQYGTMHEAIGQQQDHGRVQLGELTKRPNFFGVAALAGLHGEISIYDGEITITKVNSKGGIEPLSGTLAERQATMLVGAYVSKWSDHQVDNGVDSDRFDEFIASAAEGAGVETNEPFVFAIEGEFTNVRLHVINGACPLHARLKQLELSANDQPYERTVGKVKGKLVGVFARDAVGKLTHPATSTHAHLIYKDPETGAEVTAHVEQIGIQAGSVLRLPQ